MFCFWLSVIFIRKPKAKRRKKNNEYNDEEEINAEDDDQKCQITYIFYLM